MCPAIKGSHGENLFSLCGHIQFLLVGINYTSFTAGESGRIPIWLTSFSIEKYCLGQTIFNLFKECSLNYIDKTYRLGWFGVCSFPPANHGLGWLKAYLFHICVMISSA
jgi:hypothetical protein